MPDIVKNGIVLDLLADDSKMYNAIKSVNKLKTVAAKGTSKISYMGTVITTEIECGKMFGLEYRKSKSTICLLH